MTRIIVTLDESDKRWLDVYSASCHQSTTQTIRQAIIEFRAKEHRQILQKTAGIFKDQDTSFVRKLREEWD